MAVIDPCRFTAAAHLDRATERLNEAASALALAVLAVDDDTTRQAIHTLERMARERAQDADRLREDLEG